MLRCTVSKDSPKIQSMYLFSLVWWNLSGLFQSELLWDISAASSSVLQKQMTLVLKGQTNKQAHLKIQQWCPFVEIKITPRACLACSYRTDFLSVDLHCITTQMESVFLAGPAAAIVNEHSNYRIRVVKCNKHSWVIKKGTNFDHVI